MSMIGSIRLDSSDATLGCKKLEDAFYQIVQVGIFGDRSIICCLHFRDNRQNLVVLCRNIRDLLSLDSVCFNQLI